METYFYSRTILVAPSVNFHTDVGVDLPPLFFNLLYIEYVNIDCIASVS